MLSEPAAYDCGGVFAEGAVLGGKGGGKVAVYVEFADYRFIYEHGNY